MCAAKSVGGVLERSECSSWSVTAACFCPITAALSKLPRNAGLGINLLEPKYLRLQEEYLDGQAEVLAAPNYI